MPDQRAKRAKPQTVKERLAESYANLGMAHAALKNRDASYGRKHFMIRSRLRRGLIQGTMSIRPLADDDKLKMALPQACSYCGSSNHLSVDHLIPTAGGGPNTGENLVWACRSCNSSKGAKDMLDWWFDKHDDFPPLLLLRRYLKIAWGMVEAAGVLNVDVGEVGGLPFDLEQVPTSYPQPGELRLWVVDLPV